MKSANYTEGWTDLAIPMAADRLVVDRTYNSRNVFNGIFGFGWCSSWETTLTVNGTGQLKVTGCGGGSETLYFATNFDVQGEITSQIDLIYAEVKKRRPELSDEYIENLRVELRADQSLREEFLRRLGPSYYPLLNVTYVSSDMRGSVIFNGREFTLFQGDGRMEVFDYEGRLKRQTTAAGRWITLTYKDGRPVRVRHEDGPYLDLIYSEDPRKLAKIVSSEGSQVSYRIEKEDLREVTVTNGDRFRYGYDANHNLTRIDFPDGTFKELTYNREKDWVTSFTNRKGCVESYIYSESKDDPKNHFWSDVVKKCDGKVTNQSRYEFFHAYTENGLTYLKAARSVVNGAVIQLDYDQRGRRIKVERDGRVTYLGYDPLGRLVLFERADEVEESAYGAACDGATSLVRINRGPAAIMSRVWVAQIRYSSLCKILNIDRSDGIHLSFSYIRDGDIKITDETGFSATLSYNNIDYPVSMPDRIEIADFPPWNIEATGQGDLELSDLTRPGADKATHALNKIIGSLPLGLGGE
ncbi:hypothetical protein E0H70_07365 [Rhizobium leguminosarum bv. viciae]|nr:hypothetical protein E0H70_07365 [Rhizobium leguminosarum bv. viciae]